MEENNNDVMKNIANTDSSDLRKYLMIGGGVFVLFVIGVVVAKLVFSTPKKKETDVILPPDIKMDKQQKKDETSLFNDIPVEDDFKKPKIDEPSKIKEEQQIKKPMKIDDIEMQNPIEPAKLKVNKVEVDTLPKVKVNKSSIDTKKNYYIQVAAVTKGEPSKSFLKLITKNGFKYKIVSVNIKGREVKRVLIGGYTAKDVQEALPRVKKTITSSAFIKKLK